MVTDKQMEDLAEFLMGTYKYTTSSACEIFDINEEEITMEQWRMFDDDVFQCTCGWWCDTSETHTNKYGERICDDCYDEKNGDEQEN